MDSGASPSCAREPHRVKFRAVCRYQGSRRTPAELRRGVGEGRASFKARCYASLSIAPKEIRLSRETTVVLRQAENYRFTVEFGAAVPPLVTDESPPLGGGTGPTPLQLLAAAVGNCLSDSLHFALAKFKQSARGITTTVTATVDRNSEGRLRVVRMSVTTKLGARAAELEHLERILGQFEQFCTVAQSVGQAIPIEVAVFDGADTKLK